MTVQKISKRGKKDEKAGCYAYIIKLLIRFLKNKLYKITLDFLADSDCGKFQFRGSPPFCRPKGWLRKDARI